MTPFQFFRPPTRIWPNIDWIIIGSALALSLVGIVTMWGASATDGNVGPFAGYPKRQFLRVAIGLVAMFILLAIDFRWSRALAWPFYFIVVVALAVLLVQGQRIKGAISWVTIPIGGGGFQLQPSELGKVVLVMTLARYLSNRMHVFRGFRHTIIPLIILGLPMGLIFVQPDLGTAAVYLPTAVVMFYLAGIRKRVLIAYALLAVAVGYFGYDHLKPYQKARVQTFLNPGEDQLGKGWNVIQAQTALGSGGIFGKGWGHGTQTSFRFLPEYQTDFVFPSFGEQFGFAGGLAVLVLYAVFIGRITIIAGSTDDLYGMLLAAGFATVFAVHIILNIGMATGLLPVTGLPLPLFSYGGSFMLTCYVMIGLVLSVGARRDV